MNGWISIKNTAPDSVGRRRRAAWISAPATFIALFYALPLLAIGSWAFGLDADGSFAQTLTRVFSSPYYRTRILFTFTQALLSTGLTLLLGIPLAYLFATRRFAGKRILRASLTVPFVMPPLVVALALQSSVGRGGLLAETTGVSLLASLGPLASILVAHAIYNISLVVRIVGVAWEHLPASYADAAATLGASRRRIFTHLRLPLALPSIAAAAILVFLFCASSFGIILLLGDQRVGTVETLIFEEVAAFRPHYDTAALLGLLQLFTTLASVALYVLVARRARATFTPRTTTDLPPLRLPHRVILALGATFVLGPFVSLLVQAFRYHSRWSIEPVAILFGNRLPTGSYSIQDALGTSLVFALITALVALPLAWASLAAFRGAGQGMTLWNTILLLPLGTSAVLIGLGYLFVFDGAPLPDLRAHPSRIVLAHILIAYPFTTRVLAPAFDTLNPALLDAARTLGARTRHVLLRIELPLVAPALLAAGVFAFATSLGEFGATILLRRPEYTTLPLALFDAYSRPGEGFRAQAEVIALLLALVALLAFWLLERVRRETGGDLL
jgi:thiamine transport system permease protein